MKSERRNRKGEKIDFFLFSFEENEESAVTHHDGRSAPLKPRRERRERDERERERTANNPRASTKTIDNSVFYAVSRAALG